MSVEWLTQQQHEAGQAAGLISLAARLQSTAQRSAAQHSAAHLAGPSACWPPPRRRCRAARCGAPPRLGFGWASKLGCAPPQSPGKRQKPGNGACCERMDWARRTQRSQAIAVLPGRRSRTLGLSTAHAEPAAPQRPTCRRSASSTRSMPDAPSASSSSMRSFEVVKVGTTSSPAGLLHRGGTAKQA